MLGSGPGLVRAQWGSLYLVRWDGPATLECVETVRTDLLRLADELGSLVAINILERGTSPPGERERQVIGRTDEQLGGRLRALAYLAHGRGFLVSTAIGVLLSIRRVRMPTARAERVFGEARGAGLWLKDFLPGSVNASEVHRAIVAVQRMP